MTVQGGYCLVIVIKSRRECLRENQNSKSKEEKKRLTRKERFMRL